MERVTEIVTAFLGDLEPRTTVELHNELIAKGYFFEYRDMGAIMDKALRNNPLIEQYGPNKYCLRGGV